VLSSERLDVSHINTHQIVYELVDISSLVSKSGIKRYPACYPWSMHQNLKIEGLVEEHLNMHIQVANCQFGNIQIPH